MAWLTKERRERIARWNNWGKEPPPPITREQLAANGRFALRYIAQPLYAVVTVILLIPVLANDGHANGVSSAFYVAAAEKRAPRIRFVLTQVRVFISITTVLAPVMGSVLPSSSLA